MQSTNIDLLSPPPLPSTYQHNFCLLEQTQNFMQHNCCTLFPSPLLTSAHQKNLCNQDQIQSFIPYCCHIFFLLVSPSKVTQLWTPNLCSPNLSFATMTSSDTSFASTTTGTKKSANSPLSKLSITAKLLVALKTSTLLMTSNHQNTPLQCLQMSTPCVLLRMHPTHPKLITSSLLPHSPRHHQLLLTKNNMQGHQKSKSTKTNSW